MTLSTVNVAIEQERNNIVFRMEKSLKGSIMCEALLGSKIVCSCKVNFNLQDHTWTIAAWFTNEDMQGQGIGKQTLAHTLSCLYQNTGIPQKIKYIWNGMNPYVLEWLERHFDAKCSCPMAIQKKQPDDDWESHIYDMDVSKTLMYFGIA